MLKWLSVCVFIFSLSFAKAQWSDDMVMYSPEYVFKDGLYLNIEQFRTNNPLPLNRVISAVPENHPNYFEELLSKPSFRYSNADSSIASAKSSAIFGYCFNGRPHVMAFGEGSRMVTIGSICFFVGNEVVPINTGFGIGGGVGIGGGIGVGVPIGGSTVRQTQLILHVGSGIMSDLYPESLLKMIEDDPALAEEFSKVKKRKKRELMYAYIRKYNERNPLYLPSDIEE
jgi:hypothetical protein